MDEDDDQVDNMSEDRRNKKHETDQVDNMSKAIIHVIEFQHRGLPHAHIVIRTICCSRGHR